MEKIIGPYRTGLAILLRWHSLASVLVFTTRVWISSAFQLTAISRNPVGGVFATRPAVDRGSPPSAVPEEQREHAGVQ